MAEVHFKTDAKISISDEAVEYAKGIIRKKKLLELIESMEPNEELAKAIEEAMKETSAE
jgi:hypothetical protein